jgi:hypothetical protein
MFKPTYVYPAEKEIVKNYSDILQVVAEHVTLSQTASGWIGTFLEPRGTMVTIYVDEKSQTFQIPEMKITGDVVRFLCSFTPQMFSTTEAVLLLASRAGIKLKSQDARKNTVDLDRLKALNENAKNYFRQELKNNDAFTKELLELLRIDTKTLDQLEVGYANKSTTAFHRSAYVSAFAYEELIYSGLVSKKRKTTPRGPIIPIRDEEGQTVGFAFKYKRYRTPEPEFGKNKWFFTKKNCLFKPNKVLFNLSFAKAEMREKGFVYLTLDVSIVCQLVRLSVPNVVCLCGDNLTDFHSDLIRKYCLKIVVIKEEKTRIKLMPLVIGMVSRGFDVEICKSSEILHRLNLFDSKSDFKTWVEENSKNFLIAKIKEYETGNDCSRMKILTVFFSIAARISDQDWLKEFIETVCTVTKFKHDTIFEIVQKKQAIYKAGRQSKHDQRQRIKTRERGEYKALKFFFLSGDELSTMGGFEYLFALLSNYTFVVPSFRDLFIRIRKCVDNKGLIDVDELFTNFENAEGLRRRLVRPFEITDLFRLKVNEIGVAPELIHPINEVNLKLIETKIKILSSIEESKSKFTKIKIRQLRQIQSDY